MLKRIEMVVIFSSTLNDQELKEEVNKFQKFIEANNGKLTGTENWGKRELAFLMKKARFGAFVCFKYETESTELTAKLTALLNITESVLKCQAHRQSDKVRKVKVNPFYKKEDNEFESGMGMGDFDY